MWAKPSSTGAWRFDLRLFVVRERGLGKLACSERAALSAHGRTRDVTVVWSDENADSFGTPRNFNVGAPRNLSCSTSHSCSR